MTGNNGMMESERPHRTGSTSSSSSSSSELFICFTSRLSSSSSSSMKLSSKSILSPGRTGDPPVSFSNSLSCRRLRSMKGGQASPMFPTGSKKRGGCAAFENPEPSSPKVTCIGQVRVKTKKRTLSKRRGVSTFRKVDHQQSLTGREGILNQYQQQECLPHRNQRWVHLPLTICEALRTFGAEFSCLFPCRSSSDQREKAAGLVVAGDEEEERTLRRHAMIEIRDETYHEEEEARVSICIPPKNALLLMRCRSDPIRMAALANRFWDSPAPPIDEDDDDDDEEVKALIQGEMKDELRLMEEKKDQVLCEKLVSNEEQENHEAEEDTLVVEEVQEEDKLEIGEEFHEEHLQVTQSTEVEEGNVLAGSSSESLVDHETVKNIEEQEPKQLIPDEAKEDSHCDQYSSSSSSIVSVLLEVDEDEAETLAAAEKSTVEKETQVRLLEDEQKVTQERFEPEVEEEDTKENHDEEHDTAAESEEERESHVEVERESAVKKQERESSVLPDCLLLMMCEPKLSMEVSRETWVCSTDFIRWQPAEKQVNLMDGGDEPKKRLISTAAHHGLPPRSSCSLPAPAAAVACVSMARMIEQKLVNAVAYEPLVLTRCKSEPMRTAAKLAPPESCFWKNRKLEPHRRARFGISAAGVGF